MSKDATISLIETKEAQEVARLLIFRKFQLHPIKFEI